MTENTFKVGVTGRGYALLEFAPSEDSVIKALKENCKCYIHYQLINGTVVTDEWNNTNSEITGPVLYKNLRSKKFVKDNSNRIKKIVLSVNEKF